MNQSSDKDLTVAGVALRFGIVALALGTAYIHSTLGGLLFTLNAIGYATFAIAMIVPISLAVLGYGAARLKNVGERRTSSLDLPSVALSAMGFGGVVYGFSRAGEGGWGSPAVLGALGVGGVSLVLLPCGSSGWGVAPPRSSTCGPFRTRCSR